MTTFLAIVGGISIIAVLSIVAFLFIGSTMKPGDLP